MKKILSFSLFLILGLIFSQILPVSLPDSYGTIKSVSSTLLFICLSFIMINVGREFELDKTRWQSYVGDYFIAMATAAVPWIMVAVYYVLVLLPSQYAGDWNAWKESLLLSRFAAPTSAGILFTMLAAIGLTTSWIYKKIQVLAIFDDLDTIILMIPLQIMMIGVRWQMFAILAIVTVLLVFGWKNLMKFNMRQDWKATLAYASGVYFITWLIYYVTSKFFGHQGAIHIEVLLPAFVLGMVMNVKHIDNPTERKVSSAISFLFMFLVGMSMPYFLGSASEGAAVESSSIIGSQPMMPIGTILMHVLIVSFLSNIGKLVPILFYKDRLFEERLALSIGMFTRGEVGAGIIFIALGYKIGGSALAISILTIVLNLILTGFFVVWVKNLAISAKKKLAVSELGK